MNKVIIPTGYMGSGSSALTDLLSEFDGFEAPHGDFEYVFLHCPNGVFDLEDKLLIGNNAIRSDEALRAFLAAMQELYSEKFWWVGDYKRNLSSQFLEITQQYIRRLIQFESDSFWYYQEKRGMKLAPFLIVNRVLDLVARNKKNLRTPLKYEKMKLSLPTPDEFYAASADYMTALFEELGIGKTNLILDQLILPFNAWRVENYFDSNADCFIVSRDPRDVFLSNKYVWAKDNVQVPYPTDVKQFCEFYRRMRGSERECDNPHVHRLFFEDMIYSYDETVSIILNLLNLPSDTHQAQYSSFDPKRSIHNTQLFLRAEYKQEGDYIAEQLPEYLYSFPYKCASDPLMVF